MNKFTILKKPVLTEKSYLQSQVQNTYTFAVERRARKEEVKENIERLFNVKVVSVRTIPARDKNKRVGKYSGVKRGWKKALVTLQEGDSLDFFAAGKEEANKEEKKETNLLDKITSLGKSKKDSKKTGE